MASEPGNPNAISVFISYAGQEPELAENLASALEREGFSVVVSLRHLPYGEEQLKELAPLIAAADVVVAVVSPAYIASRVCNWELAQTKAAAKRFVPIMAAPVEPHDLPEIIASAHLLPSYGTFDFKADVRPLAVTLNADRQWIKEHTRLGAKAHQWSMRGREPSLLLRGEALDDAESWQDRRPTSAPPPSDEILELMLASRRAATERLRGWVAGSLAASVFAAALAGLAAYQWQRAETGYAAARANLDALVTDVAGQMRNTEGMPVAAIQHILRNGETLASGLKQDGAGDMRLEQSRAAMLYEFGKTWQKIGGAGDAAKASEESLAIRRKLSAAHPQNTELQAELADSLDLAGDLEREQKRYDEARGLYGEASRIGLTLNAKAPADTDYAVNLSKTLIRLGDLDSLSKNYFEAKGRYLDAFEKIKAALRGSEGEPPIALQRELSWNYTKIGDVATGLKEYAEADVAYGNGLCVREYLSSKDPADTKLQHDVSASFDKAAGAKMQANDFTGALDAAFASLAIRRRLSAGDPGNLIWRRDAASSLHLIGEIKAQSGDFLGARMFFLAAAEARLALKKDAPEDQAFATTFQASMDRAKEVLTQSLASQPPSEERGYREAVAEEEANAAAKLAAKPRDPSACWASILTTLRGGARVMESAAK
jgi:tetratricopeptide (TPR) repeat protein